MTSLDAAINGEERRQLESERAFLLRSIEDLEAEKVAGDITDDDYLALRSRYTARAAAVLRRLQGEADAAPSPPAGAAGETASVPAAVDAAGSGRPRRRRRVFLWGALAAFVAAAVVLVVAEVSTRLPGETVTGSISLSAVQQLQRTLAQAETLEAQGNGAEALRLYQEVLHKDPTQEQALAESGWLEYEAGALSHESKLLSSGQADEEAAEHVDPGAYAPHLYLASMLLAEGDYSESASEFTIFLSSSPPVTAEQSAWPFVVKAFTRAREVLPPVPAGVHG